MADKLDARGGSESLFRLVREESLRRVQACQWREVRPKRVGAGMAPVWHTRHGQRAQHRVTAPHGLDALVLLPSHCPFARRDRCDTAAYGVVRESTLPFARRDRCDTYRDGLLIAWTDPRICSGRCSWRGQGARPSASRSPIPLSSVHVPVKGLMDTSKGLSMDASTGLPMDASTGLLMDASMGLPMDASHAYQWMHPQAY